MPKGWRHRAVTLALVLGLLATSTLLVANLDRLRASISLPTPATGREVLGQLLVEAWLLENVNNLPVMRPLQRLPIALTRGNVPVTPLPLYTNANGVLRMRLPVGEYLVSVDDPRFQLAVKVQVLGDHTTHLRLTLRKLAVPPIFAELSDSDRSGWVDPWERLVVGVPLGALDVSPGRTVFVESRLNPRGTQATPSTIISVAEQGQLLLLQMRPLTQLGVSGISSMELVVYEPTYEVRVYAG